MAVKWEKKDETKRNWKIKDKNDYYWKCIAQFQFSFIDSNY